MSKVVMGIGIPSSGKTTAMKNFAEKNSYSYICPDDIRHELLGDVSNQSKNKEVWEESYKRLKEKMTLGETVVFDATFANSEQRKDFINFAKKNGAEKVQGVFLDIDLDIAKERNELRERVVPSHVLERMHKSLQDFPPEITDGFDSIFTLDEYQNLVNAELETERGMYSKEFGKMR